MPVSSPRDFESWMRLMERRVNELARAGRGSLIDLIDRQVEGGTGGGAGEARTPAAPTVVVYSPALYVDDNGTTRVALSVSFQPVTLATDGQPISIDRYEVWAYETVDEDAPWTLQAVSRSNSMVIRPYQEGSVWAFRVRAIGTTAINPGLYSPGFVVTMAADTTPPPIPSKPTVKVTSGVFQVQWDGLDAAGNPMPPDFSHVEIAAGTASSPTVLTGRRLRGAGLEVFTGTTYGQTWYFRFFAVDSSGNVSPWSGNASGKAVPLVSIDGLSLEEALIAQQEAAQNAQDAAAVARAAAISARADADLAADQAAILQAEADTAESAYITSRADQDPVMLGIVGLNTIVYDAVAPEATDVLWIDISTSTPYVWDGVEWVAVVDPDFEAALGAVLTAQSAWNEAQAAADVASIAAAEASIAADVAEADALDAEAEAQTRLEEATAVYISARGGNKITYTFDEPSPAYTGTFGDTWFQHDGTGTVIGYWQWTGGAWAQREVGSQVIANLDVGKLTAGAATIDTLAAQQIAAETAEFLEARAEWFGANKIEADWIGVGAIQAVHIGLGQVPAEALAFGIDELSPNPMWIDSARRVLFPPEAGMDFVSTPALMQRGQTFVLSIAPGGARTMPLSWAMPCTPGEKFYLRHESQHTSADWTVALGLEFFDVDGISLGVFDVPSSTLDPVDVYTPYEDVLDAPSGAAEVRLLLVTTVGTVGTWAVSATSWRRAMASTGTGGQRLEISPAAIRLWGPEPDEGQASVDISTNGAEVITLRSPTTDEPVIVLDSAGAITAQHISTLSLSVGGAGISGLLGDRPFGTLAKTKLVVNLNPVATSNRAVASADVVLPGTGDRQVRLTFGVEVDAGGDYPMAYDIKFSTTATAATTNSTHTSIDGEVHSVPRWYTYVYEFNTGELGVDPLGDRFLSILVCARTSVSGETSGSVTLIGGAGQDGTYLLVEDMGSGVPTGRQLTGGTGEAVGLVTRTSPDTGSKWGQTYKGDGTQYATYPDRLYQGYYLASNGVMKSAIGAPDVMFTNLAGATVEWIEVWLESPHWYQGDGGDAVIGLHGNSSKPSTFPGINQTYVVKFRRGEGKWVRLPLTWNAGFKSGSNRGITLNAGNSTSSLYYGYFLNATKWRWRYTK